MDPVIGTTCGRSQDTWSWIKITKPTNMLLLLAGAGIRNKQELTATNRGLLLFQTLPWAFLGGNTMVPWVVKSDDFI